MRRLILASTIASLAGFAGTVAAAPPAGKAERANGPAPTVDVMTQNQYLGADTAPLIAAIAEGPAAFNTALITALAQIAENRTPERVTALAAQILERKPHLVGLQEVWEFACTPAPNAAYDPCVLPPVAGAFSDHLALTTAALGDAYVLEAVVQDLTATLPFTFDGVNFAFVSVRDRDAIFARRDVADATEYHPLCDVPSPSGQGCNYTARLYLGPIPPVTRGFVAVHTEIDGTSYLFVNTHLEVEEIFNPGDPVPIQSQQAEELISVLEDQGGVDRLVLVGDTNSSPNDAAFGAPTPYTLFDAAGLYDAWVLRPGNVAGYSCCQLADLSNRVSVLDRRIDLIYTREMPDRVKEARLIGEVAADRLAPPGLGLWPSDHSSVAASLQY